MPTLDQLASVTVTRQTVFPTLPGFGTPALFAYHSYWLDRIRTFQQLTELVDAGVDTDDPIYKWSTAVFSQNPRPEKVAICRRALAYTQTITLTPQSATEDDVYTFTVADASGTSTDISYTVLAAATLTTVGTALALLIDAALGTDGDAASVAGVITITMDAGKVCLLENLPPISKMLVAETTADPGIATDFTDIQLAEQESDALSFFSIDLDCAGKATIVALAAAVEATKKILVVPTSDSACATSSTTDVMSTLKASAYERTLVIFAQYSNRDYRSGALVGKMLPATPGSATWAYKTLAGIHADSLRTSEADYITAKYGTTYQTIANVNLTYQGQVPSGDFIDNIIASTELQQACQLAIISAFVANEKIPFTAFGISCVRGVLEAVIDARTAKKAADKKFLANDPAPLIIMPAIADISAADKAARILRGVQIQAYIAGAIHRGVISINLSV